MFINKNIVEVMRKVIKVFLSFLEIFSNYFITYHIRPKLSEDVALKLKSSNDFESKNIGIVMQGPLVLKESLTLETLKLYVMFFPSYKLILSTWHDEDLITLNIIRKLGVDVVLNEKPVMAGIANVNFQIVSSSEGIKRAKTLGCEYVLKTRTDQRIYSREGISFCYAAIKKFPLLKKFDQKERIISFNLNTFMYRPYGISDMINFGYIDDMSKYWCVKLDLRSQKDLKEYSTLLEFSQQRLAEVYFLTSFLDNINRGLSWTLEDSWKVMSENFCILNTSDIDLFWKKYTNKEFRHEDYKAIHNKQFNFSDWLIFQDQLPIDIPEYIINIRLDQLDSF